MVKKKRFVSMIMAAGGFYCCGMRFLCGTEEVKRGSGEEITKIF